MAPLTWRNVDAPNFQGVADALRIFGSSINSASSGLTDAIDSYQEGRTQAQSGRLMQQVLGATSPEAINAAIASQDIDPRYLSADAFNFAANYRKQLEANNIARQRLALSGSRRGSGSGGGRGGQIIPDNSDYGNTGGMIDENGNLVGASPAPVTAPQTQPAQSVIPQTPVLSGGPTRENAAAMLQQATAPVAITTPKPAQPSAPVESVPAVDNTTTGATSGPVVTSNAATGQISDPVQQLVTSLRPVPGPVRGPNRPRGNDGGAQIFPQLAQDVGNARIAAIQGDVDAANNAFVNNPRIQRNLTATNVLTSLDKNLEAAEAGIKLRANIREENNAVRNQNISDAARMIAEQAVSVSGSPEEAKASLNIQELGPAAYTRAIDMINDFTKGGAYGDFTASAVSQVPDTAPQKDKDAAAAADASPVKGVTTTPDGGNATTAVSPAVQAIQRSVAQVNDRFAYDRSGDANGPVVAALSAASEDTSSVADVVKKATGKGGAFEGMREDEYMAYLQKAMDAGLPRPAMAAIALENARQSPDFLSFMGIGDSRVSSEKISNIAKMFTDPATGYATGRFLQEQSVYRQSTQAQKDIETAAAEAVKAQQELEKLQRLKATSRPNLDTSKAEQKAQESRSKAQNLIEAVLAPGGAASLYRGNPNRPQEVEGPRATYLPQANYDERVIDTQTGQALEAENQRREQEVLAEYQRLRQTQRVNSVRDAGRLRRLAEENVARRRGER